MKNRGLKDILNLFYCIESGFQRCIVHQVRNTLKHVSAKFAADLKKIYNAPDEKSAAVVLDQVAEKWREKYPHAMKSWTMRFKIGA